MNKNKPFGPNFLALDCESEVTKSSEKIRDILAKKFKRRGLIVAISGGIDSSVTAALSVQAVGSENVFGLLMPEQDSSEDTLSLSKIVVESLGINHAYENITPILSSLKCYEKRDEAIKEIIPEFSNGWKSKIVLPSVVDSDRLNYYSVVALSPEEKVIKKRLPQKNYLAIVAATNFKQRVRKMLEYYHADRLNYAVAGTPNRLEYDQGFFVKLGDGTADVKPIAHLYKSQVYQLADYLGVPEEIRKRNPTTDTYSMPQSQDEFYFSLPYREMDLCLYGFNNNIPISEVADAAGLTVQQTERVYRDIRQKRRTSRYLHMSPVLTGSVPEIDLH